MTICDDNWNTQFLYRDICCYLALLLSVIIHNKTNWIYNCYLQKKIYIRGHCNKFHCSVTSIIVASKCSNIVHECHPKHLKKRKRDIDHCSRDIVCFTENLNKKRVLSKLSDRDLLFFCTYMYKRCWCNIVLSW